MDWLNLSHLQILFTNTVRVAGNFLASQLTQVDSTIEALRITVRELIGPQTAHFLSYDGQPTLHHRPETDRRPAHAQR